jgi:oligoribonuclease
MPRLNERGHYRMVDVSTLKVLIQAWYQEQPEIDFKKSKTHRAQTDIHESIEELRHYRKYFFK